MSAETGEGLRELLDYLLARLATRHAALAGPEPLVTRARHRQALGAARDEVAAFLQAWEQGALPAPIAAVHVRAAIGSLEELVGAIDVEDVLGRVFGTFCVGK